jgi:SEC-C motif domain protein
VTPRSGRCPCGSGESYDLCCGPLHAGQTNASTARTLMQSRFTAFAMGDERYLLATWHPSTRPARLELDDDRTWAHLEIVEAERGGLFDDSGVVEFRAHYRSDGRRGVQHERSTFSRDNGQWRYLGAEPTRH